jgi:hypothetical protein
MFELDLTQPIEIQHHPSDNPFDKHEGDRRTELKNFNRTIHYRGFEIKRNANVPNGGFGFWEIPNLQVFEKGSWKVFMSCAKNEATTIIDKFYDNNEEGSISKINS